MRQSAVTSEKVIPLPGIRPLRLNITKMPENHVLHYNETFRVNCAKLVQGDFSDLVSELVGKRFILPSKRGYRVEQVVSWHGFWNVIENGERAPCYRLYLSLSHDQMPLIL